MLTAGIICIWVICGLLGYGLVREIAIRESTWTTEDRTSVGIAAIMMAPLVLLLAIVVTVVILIEILDQRSNP